MTHTSSILARFVADGPPLITRTRTGRGLAAVQALLAAGELRPGDRLHWHERGLTHTATVEPDGRFRVTGQLASSPSRAAHIAHGARRPDGWEVWTCERDGETLASKRSRVGLDPR